MSEFLDELARSLAAPMTRQRALRVAGAVVVGALLPGRSALAAVAGLSATCPGVGDLLCDNCPNVNGLNYGHVCCPGPNAAEHWECDCKPGPGGHNGCKPKQAKKPDCPAPCGKGCCDNGTKCCKSSAAEYPYHCCGKGTTCCRGGCCPAGTHCCPTTGGKYEVSGAVCCPDNWACCGSYCCMPGTQCVDETGKPTKYVNGTRVCSHGDQPPFAKKAENYFRPTKAIGADGSTVR